MRMRYVQLWFKQLTMVGESLATLFMLTKNIFQIHNRYEDLKVFERVSVERWRAINPDWNYHLMLGTELSVDDYIRDNWPKQADLFSSMSVIQKSQIRRAALIHQNGGLYADCDIYPLHPLSDRIPDRDSAWYALKDRDDGRKFIADYFFYSVAGNPILTDIIDEAFERTANGDALKKKNPVGFIFETSSIHCYSHVVVNVHGKERLPWGDNWICDLESNPNECLFYHYSTESWIAENRFVRDNINPFEDEMHHLNAVKYFTGI